MHILTRSTTLLAIVFAKHVASQANSPTTDQISRVKADFQAVDKAATDLDTQIHGASLTDDSAKQTKEKSLALASAMQVATADVLALPDVMPDEDAREVLTTVTGTGKTTTDIEDRLIDVKKFIDAYGAGSQTAASIVTFRNLSKALNSALYDKTPADLQVQLKTVTDKMQSDFDRAAKAYARELPAGATATNGSGSTPTASAPGGANNSASSANNTSIADGTSAPASGSTAQASGVKADGALAKQIPIATTLLFSFAAVDVFGLQALLAW